MANCDKKLDWADASSDEELYTHPEPTKPPAEPRRGKKSTVVTKPPAELRKEHKKPTVAAEPRRTVVTEPPAKPRQRRDQKSTEPKKEGQCPFCAFATHSNPEDFPEELKACCCMWCPKSNGRRHGERCKGIKA